MMFISIATLPYVQLIIFLSAAAFTVLRLILFILRFSLCNQKTSVLFRVMDRLNEEMMRYENTSFRVDFDWESILQCIEYFHGLINTWLSPKFHKNLFLNM